MPIRKGKLNAQEQRFVVLFVGPARGNGTKAAEGAGYSRHTARRQASRLLTRVHVQQAILELNSKRTKVAMLTADRADQILSEIANDPNADLHARIQAIREWNRCRGRHSITHHVDGDVTLEVMLAGSRGMKLVGGGKA